MASRAKTTTKKSTKTSPARKTRAAASSTKKSSSTPRKKSSSTRKPSTSAPRSRSPKPLPPQTIRLSNENKLDIAGIVLLAIGLLSLLGKLTAAPGRISGRWSDFLTSTVGWGAFVFPIILLLVGLWFILRNLEQMPRISAERGIGIVLVFFNKLAWFQLLSRASIFNGVAGGGSIGKFILDTLSRWFGSPGAVIWLIAWLLTSLVLLIDLSLATLTGSIATFFQRIWSKLRAAIQNRAAQRQPSSQSLPASPHVPIQGEPLAQQPQTQAAAVQAGSSAQTPAAASTHTWVLPVPEDILSPVVRAQIDEEDDQGRAHVIETTLRSLGVPGHVVEILRGPTITMFGVEPDYIESRSGKTRVRVSAIVRLENDLAMALKAPSIRIQAPVPGKAYIGIEVPNQKLSLVSLLEILQSPAFATSKDPLKLALGKNVLGQAYCADLTEMPHLLIAGTTNSGKSVCLNAILATFLFTKTPDELRLVLVDPKRVELTGYDGIPHLLAPVVVDRDKVLGALNWMIREMSLRYKIFSESNTRNLAQYNSQQISLGSKTLPHYLVVIDELADLMMVAQVETEEALIRLAQLARATGIHLILATQRPSANIITGLIKANFPARIAFSVASNVDSRVILDQPGAEHLLGRGDMLFQSPTASAPVRLQGTYVSDAEISRLVAFWREQSVQTPSDEKPDLAVFSSGQQILRPDAQASQETLWEELEKDPDEDPITAEALAIIRKEGRASVSMLQRKLRIGYTRSSRLIEKLEEQGIIGPPDSQTGTREVLDWGNYPPLNED